MRILLDCHNLRGGPLGAEKRLFMARVAAILSEKEGVEWLVLVDRAYLDEFQGVGQSLPVQGTSRGRWLWKHWRLPRIVKKYKPDRVMSIDEMREIPGAADERYRPLTGEEKEEVKNRFAEGKEYFLADVGGMRKDQIVGLLKAFSLFKKRQRSNMRFVLRGKDIPIDLQHYKYRSEICFCVDAGEEEWRRLVGAAYALILPSGVGGLTIFNAWKTETPVIDGDPGSLAAQLMSMYTNEGLRTELIGKGRDRLRSYSWERSAAEVWDLITAGGKSAINK